jgi:hypothetical protein
VPVFCVPNTSVDTVIELMNEKQGENGVWVINENKVPLEMLHCTDLIRFLLLKEKKQREDLEEKDQYLEWDRTHPPFYFCEMPRHQPTPPLMTWQGEAPKPTR